MEIQEIKQQLTIDQVLNHYNLKPDKSQRLKCPWHEDKTPSLQIFTKQIAGHALAATAMQAVEMQSSSA